MEKQVFQFGDKKTADIKLDIDGDEENPIYLHSQILKKSEFYEARLSNERPLELKIRSSVDPEIYVKCFQLMYSCEAEERFHFSDVDEALAILPAVSEMLFHEGIQKCMEYLEAVRWSPEQETKVLAMLSSLQMNILPDLAARLAKNIRGDLGMLKKSLKDMLSAVTMIPARLEPKLGRTEVEQYILGYFEAANKYSAKAVADTCRSALLEEFRSELLRIELIRTSLWSSLLWLFDLIRRCDWTLYETCVELFCLDPHLSSSVSQVGVEEKLYILLSLILNPMAKAEIVTPHSLRVSFLTKWLGEMVRLAVCLGSAVTFEALERGFIDVADTLPLSHQKNIYTIWKDVYIKLELDYSNAMRWWAGKVQDAINHGKII